MTPLSYQIGQALLPVCLEETRKARELYAKTQPAKLSPKAEKIKKIIEGLGTIFASNSGAKQLQALVVEIADPVIAGELATAKLAHEFKSIIPVYNPLTVIVIERDLTGHKMVLEVPRIVTHGKEKLTLWLDDETFHPAYNYKTTEDETRVATDEEVEACVMSLSARQLKIVMTHDLFAPIVNPLFEEQTELVAADDQEPTLQKPVVQDFNDDLKF